MEEVELQPLGTSLDETPNPDISISNDKLDRKEKKRVKEELERQARKEKALQSMQYVLGMSEKYSAYFKQKIQQVKDARGVLKPQSNNRLMPTMKEMVEEHDALLVQNNYLKKKKMSDDDSPKLKYFTGQLKPYQVEGVTWLTMLHKNAVNGILADEMGLGKTVQVIAFLCHLIEKNNQGPFMIVVPLSTLSNWEAEFKRFAPKIPVVVFYGNDQARKLLYKKVKSSYSVDDKRTKPVVITTYQMPNREQRFLGSITWEYIIIDEGHRIKNHECLLARQLRDFQSKGRLILTGTPLQNNLTELWALLNFVMPVLFADMDSFSDLLAAEDFENDVKTEQSTNIISVIHKVLAPFMLRRLKADVLTDMVPKKEMLIYCPLTQLQKNLYTYTIEKNIAKLRGLDDSSEPEDKELHTRKKRKCTKRVYYTDMDFDKYSQGSYESLNEDVTSRESLLSVCSSDSGCESEYKNTIVALVKMQNPLMMFRKIVNHPYLVHFPLDPHTKNTLRIDEDIIKQSGKMLVLDAMLKQLKEDGHKVLIFCTLVIMLDLIEELMIMRGHEYRRLDGSHSLEVRHESITDFNEDKDILAFLISTRAGGLGLNLVGADTVIFVDRDWNPQVDIQAQDRCHRIGQTKPVMIYSLVTKNTIDETVIHRGTMKRRLEKAVIKDGKFKITNTEEKRDIEQELVEMQELLNNIDGVQPVHPDGYVFTKEELKALLDRSELYNEMENNRKTTVN